jgi:hypothetical protein
MICLHFLGVTRSLVAGGVHHFHPKGLESYVANLPKALAPVSMKLGKCLCKLKGGGGH